MEKILKETLEGGVFKDVAPLHSKLMKAIKGKGNKTTEVTFRLALVRARIHGWKMQAKLKGRPDFFFPKQKLVVFLDGCYWHGCPKCGHVPKTNSLYWSTKIGRNIERDWATTAVLAEAGYQVLRFWEHELKAVGNCIKRLEQQLKELEGP